MAQGDPLGIFSGQPDIPPWAVPLGLHPPYPGGSFDEYLDPNSPHFRPDIVSALANSRQRAEQEIARKHEQSAALYRARLAAVQRARTPHELARAVAALGSQCDEKLAWDTWHQVRDAQLWAPTHDLVRVTAKYPVLGPRFVERERRAAWHDPAVDRFLDDEDRVYVRGRGQPMRNPERCWYPVAPGKQLEARVHTSTSTGRFTMISANPYEVSDLDHWGVTLGVLEEFARRETGDKR